MISCAVLRYSDMPDMAIMFPVKGARNCGSGSNPSIVYSDYGMYGLFMSKILWKILV